MHDNEYENNFDTFQIKKRIKYAVNNNVNTCILTGTGEALQNTKFLNKLVEIFIEMDHPFPNVELQTSGVLLNKYFIGNVKPYDGEIFYEYIPLLKKLGVNTISVSVSDIFDSENNMNIIGTPEKLKFDFSIFKFIKDQGFNLRLSLNLTNVYNKYSPEKILNKCKEYGANHVTFRKLYEANNDSSQSEWVRKNSCNLSTLQNINNYIVGYDGIDELGKDYHYKGFGTPLYNLPFGPKVYSIKGMSVVVDNNCMNKNNNENLKYIILREDGKLYAAWDDQGSLIF